MKTREGQRQKDLRMRFTVQSLNPSLAVSSVLFHKTPPMHFAWSEPAESPRSKRLLRCTVKSVKNTSVASAMSSVSSRKTHLGTA